MSKILDENLAINIIIAEYGPNAAFVEIENDNGESIRIGTVEDCGDGLTKIRITIADILDIKTPSSNNNQ